MNETSSKSEDLEVLPPSASEALESAAVNSQIATAKRYPRSLQLFKSRAIDMACLDDETAESCLYRRPVGKKDGVQQFAEGMSIRMAEIVGASYGNLRVQAQIIEQTPRFVRARGTAIDLESNYASSSEVIEATVKRDGTPYDERMRIVIAKAALSKAKRDATFSVVPRALAKPVETAVRNLLMGDSEALTKRRAKVVAWISKLGIDPKRVYGAIGLKGEADLGVEHLEHLTGLRTALKDNEVTIDEAFPDLHAGVSIGDALAGKKNSADEKADPKPDEKKEKPRPFEDHPQEAHTDAEFKALVTKVENYALNLGLSEAKLIKWAQEAGCSVPAKTAKLSALPYATLEKVLAHCEEEAAK